MLPASCLCIFPPFVAPAIISKKYWIFFQHSGECLTEFGALPMIEMRSSPDKLSHAWNSQLPMMLQKCDIRGEQPTECA
ncbi:MAG: hypothetical protein ABI579_06730, partial [Candidatus Sumerlaeota bacterium]